MNINQILPFFLSNLFFTKMAAAKAPRPICFMISYWSIRDSIISQFSTLKCPFKNCKYDSKTPENSIFGSSATFSTYLHILPQHMKSGTKLLEMKRASDYQFWASRNENSFMGSIKWLYVWLIFSPKVVTNMYKVEIIWGVSFPKLGQMYKNCDLWIH